MQLDTRASLDAPAASPHLARQPVEQVRHKRGQAALHRRAMWEVGCILDPGKHAQAKTGQRRLCQLLNDALARCLPVRSAA